MDKYPRIIYLIEAVENLVNDGGGARARSVSLAKAAESKRKVA